MGETSTKEDDRVLTAQQAAEHMNCSYITLLRHAVEWGGVKPRGSRVYRFRKRKLDEILGG